MLNSNYNDTIIGKNYLSLIYGTLRILKNKNSKVLIIDEADAQMGNHWYKNIGEIEKLIFEKIGKKYNLSSIQKMKNYLKPINTIILLDEKMIELGSSPFANIRELARKLPECFPREILEKLNLLGPDKFDEICFDFFDNMADKVFINQTDKNFHSSEDNLNRIFDDFIKFINQPGLLTEQVHYVLQVLFQTFFSNSKNDDESRYLLTSILSPRYEVDEKGLLDDLQFEFRNLGGDIITANISDWEIYESSLKYIMLDSLDGVIGFENLYMFCRVPKKAPFSRKDPQMEFNSISLECPIEHDILNFYKNKRILFSKDASIGTDFPHFEICINEDGILSGTFSYANNIGTKSSFYYKKVTEDIFKNLPQILPGVEKDDWAHQITFTDGGDFWTENLSSKKSIDKYIKHNDILYQIDDRKKIDNLYYCGPNRTKRMGLYSYTWDILSTLN
jgi:hypothetical protein